MATRQNEWVKRVWQETIEAFGAACAHCGLQWDLEFAHKEPTRVKGRGRGKSRRLADIRKHPEKYLLLCVECHATFDGRQRRRRL